MISIRLIKKIVISLAVTGLFGGCVSSKPSFTAQSIVLSVGTETQNATLASCVDGDTAHFMVNGNDLKVRFLSIDAPEIAHEDNTEEPYGDEAAYYTCDHLQDASTILLESDPFEDPTDRYGRVLAWVWIDGVLLQGLLIEAGYAEVAFVKTDNLHSVDLMRLEEAAFKAKRGIWGQ